jgi:heme-degrading monooxygenase HmoA
MIAVINRLPVKEGAAEQVIDRFANSQGYVQEFPGFVSMEVLNSEVGDEVLVLTRWRDKDSWVHSDAFKRAHGRSGGGDLLRGHPQMSTYEVAVERESEPPGE